MGGRGLRVADLLDSNLVRETMEKACGEKNMIANGLFNSEPLDADAMYREYAEGAKKIAPFVTDTADLINRALAAGESVMFEGAQGTMLDIDHGTYPFVTSSSATSGGAVTGTGVPPNAIHTVIGVSKASCTRVGEGPFPSEIDGPVAEQLRARGNEYGAVTGRPRRCGWVDLPLLRYAQMINGVNWWVVTKLDVLDELDEVPVCVGYKINGKKTDTVPALATGFEKVQPVYQKMPGWKKSTEGITELARLPKKAQEYLRVLEQETGARIGMISTGPDREQTIFVPEFTKELAETASTTTKSGKKSARAK